MNDRPPQSSSIFSLQFGLLPSDFDDVPRPLPSPSAKRRAAAAKSKPRRPEDGFEITPPPEQFVLLEDIGAVLYRLWKWSISKERSSFEAPTPATKAATLPAIDPSAHRYPYCLVWTPIHPITWVAPYVGHVGLCDEEGVVLDFAGKHVGRDAMAFGWPARYVQLSPFVNEEINWDGEIGRAKQQFRRVEYNFLTVRIAL